MCSATVVQDFSTFWEGVKSDTINVAKRAVDNSSQSTGISTTREPVVTTVGSTTTPRFVPTTPPRKVCRLCFMNIYLLLPIVSIRYLGKYPTLRFNIFMPIQIPLCTLVRAVVGQWWQEGKKKRPCLLWQLNSVVLSFNWKSKD